MQTLGASLRSARVWTATFLARIVGRLGRKHVKRPLLFFLVAVTGLAWPVVAHGAEPSQPKSAAAQQSRYVYGEWRIQIRPDKLKEYAQLIETKGLPLFREAGGRMVGWWTTMVGDLYEHITIWEYDDMAAFEQAGQKLGADKRFAEFVSLRDPLLDGETNCFLRLTDFADKPALPEQSKIVIHEVHRVPLARRDAYLKYMQSEGLALLNRHGFRPVGPWVVNVGASWSNVTYLFRFDSLREREDLIAGFTQHNDARQYAAKIGELTDDVTTRILMPGKFAHPSTKTQP
jgi:hypothetical protein